MVFVLDNYDSFTYNLVQYLGELGAKVEVRRNDQVTVAEVEAMQPERIVISPGPCTPQDAGISIDLIRHFAGKVPVLGVCLGHQAIGAAFGGQCGARSSPDARQDQRRHARQQNHLPRPAHAHDGHALSLAHRGRERSAGRTRSQRLDYRERWNPHHHGPAPQKVCRRGSAVSSRERADGCGEEAGGEFSSSSP